MTSYTIANLPTLYRGRMYRSRLEARWAAFFDRLGWAYEYEPFDLGAWSPDFLLTDLDTLVEVKPIAGRDVAAIDAVMAKLKRSAPDRSVLMVGTSPYRQPEEDRPCLVIGQWHAPEPGWREATLWWRRGDDRPVFEADLLTSDGENIWTCRGGGPLTLRQLHYRWFEYNEQVERLWADATNAVQWEPHQ